MDRSRTRMFELVMKRPQLKTDASIWPALANKTISNRIGCSCIILVLFLMPFIRSDSDLSMLDSCRSAVDELRFHSLKKEAKGTKRSSLVSPSFCPQWLPESAKKMKGPYRSLNIYISSLFFKTSLILLLYSSFMI